MYHTEEIEERCVIRKKYRIRDRRDGYVGYGIDVEYEETRAETYDLVGVSMAGLNCAA
jgi:hypothetical protein